MKKAIEIANRQMAIIKGHLDKKYSNDMAKKYIECYINWASFEASKLKRNEQLQFYIAHAMTISIKAVSLFKGKNEKERLKKMHDGYFTQTP